MARTPSAHWVPQSLQKRVPYTDKPFIEQVDPNEISLGNGHRDISHLLEIIYDSQAPCIAKTKALRLLNDILPGRQAEAIYLDAFEALRPLLLQPPGGLLLNTLLVLNTIVDTLEAASQIIDDIPRIVEILDPQIEPPLRIASASLLHKISELLGSIPEFFEGDIPIKIVVASSSYPSTPLLMELFPLLSILTNNQTIRVPLIDNKSLLKIIIKSITDPQLQKLSINLCENIAMDNSHNGKLALLHSNILSQIGPLLKSPKIELRMSVISLLTLLAVPKEGKERIAKDQLIPSFLKNISEFDCDLHCRRAAMKCRVIVAELPFGRSVVGNVIDPSVPKRKEEKDKKIAIVKPNKRRVTTPTKHREANTVTRGIIGNVALPPLKEVEENAKSDKNEMEIVEEDSERNETKSENDKKHSDNKEIKSENDKIEEVHSDEEEIKSGNGEKNSDNEEVKPDKEEIKSENDKIEEVHSDGEEIKSGKEETEINKNEMKSESGEKNSDNEEVKSEKSEKEEIKSCSDKIEEVHSDNEEVKTEKSYSGKIEEFHSDNEEVKPEKSDSDKIEEVHSNNKSEKSETDEKEENKSEINKFDSDKDEIEEIQIENSETKSEIEEVKDAEEVKSENSELHSEDEKIEEIQSDKEEIEEVNDAEEVKSENSELHSEDEKIEEIQSDKEEISENNDNEKSHSEDDKIEEVNGAEEIKSENSELHSEDETIEEIQSEKEEIEEVNDAEEVKSENSELHSEDDKNESDKNKNEIHSVDETIVDFNADEEENEEISDENNSDEEVIDEIN
ncbi:Phosphoribulokinase / Uridine kinase family protein [Histomonas meleagridis]|uniref:Phosphoribulokinase / Uridine kinase family protein n=1 Tax=Histomonas meleagridis TaxID=135588 RepID=UPI00355A0899|nr:Phosphoribulokinase / Uridine kinase family protein [Histomonas meleagridis]KAH0798123.1 Phosphoribulokinase / Uridine kinase family protein [Histomonas meleagridis]